MEDRTALLSLSHLVQRLTDCSQSMTKEHIENAMRQHAIVSRVCSTKHLFSDCYGSLPMESIQVAHERLRVQNIESHRTSQDVSNIQNLVSRMSNLQDLIAIASALETLLLKAPNLIVFQFGRMGRNYMEKFFRAHLV